MSQEGERGDGGGGGGGGGGGTHLSGVFKNSIRPVIALRMYSLSLLLA